MSTALGRWATRATPPQAADGSTTSSTWRPPGDRRHLAPCKRTSGRRRPDSGPAALRAIRGRPPRHPGIVGTPITLDSAAKL